MKSRKKNRCKKYENKSYKGSKKNEVYKRCKRCPKSYGWKIDLRSIDSHTLTDACIQPDRYMRSKKLKKSNRRKILKRSNRRRKNRKLNRRSNRKSNRIRRRTNRKRTNRRKMYRKKLKGGMDASGDRGVADAAGDRGAADAAGDSGAAVAAGDRDAAVAALVTRLPEGTEVFPVDATASDEELRVAEWKGKIKTLLETNYFDFLETSENITFNQSHINELIITLHNQQKMIERDHAADSSKVLGIILYFLSSMFKDQNIPTICSILLILYLSRIIDIVNKNPPPGGVVAVEGVLMDSIKLDEIIRLFLNLPNTVLNSEETKIQEIITELGQYIQFDATATQHPQAPAPTPTGSGAAAPAPSPAPSPSQALDD